MWDSSTPEGCIMNAIVSVSALRCSLDEIRSELAAAWKGEAAQEALRKVDEYAWGMESLEGRLQELISAIERAMDGEYG